MGQAFGDSENNAFRNKMWGYLQDPGGGGRVPDIRESGDPTADDEELMKMIMAYLGSQGWLDYERRLSDQRGRGRSPAPMPSPTPTMTPTPGPLVGGMGERDRRLEEEYRRIMNGG